MSEYDGNGMMTVVLAVRVHEGGIGGGCGDINNGN